jgi:hypothetical protein
MVRVPCGINAGEEQRTRSCRKQRVIRLDLTFSLCVCSVLCTFKIHVCTKCGSMLSPILDKPVTTTEAASAAKTRRWRCRVCPDNGNVVKIRVPQVFAYMVAELAAINIKTQLTVKQD